MIRRPPCSTRTDTLFPYTTLFRSIGIGGAVGRAVDWNGPSQTLAAIAWHRHTSSSVMNDGVIDASLRVGHLKNGGLLIITDHDDIAIGQALVNRINLELGRIWIVVRCCDLPTYTGQQNTSTRTPNP